MAKIGYKRVSTLIQNTERQLNDLALDITFEDKVSGKTIDRPKLNECKQYCRKGDELYIHSLDRVCRSGVGDAVDLVNEMLAQGVAVHFVKESLSFTGTMSALQEAVLSILATVAKLERDLINERVREGVAIAKAKGRMTGRPKLQHGLTKEKVIELRQHKSVKEICKEYGIGKSSLYTLIKAD